MPRRSSIDVRVGEDNLTRRDARHRGCCCCRPVCHAIGCVVACLCDQNSCLWKWLCCSCRCACGHHKLRIVQFPPGSTFDTLIRNSQETEHNACQQPGLSGSVQRNFVDQCSPEEELRTRVKEFIKSADFKTGDVIAFNDAYWGEHALRDMGRQIQRVQQHAPITHVGIVYAHPETQRVFVVEAVWYTDTETTPEAFTGRLFSRRSMHVFDLIERSIHVNADLYHLPLVSALSGESVARATKFMEESYVRDPPFDYASMYLAGEDCFDGCGGEAEKNDDSNGFFCAEFVSRTLIEAGVLPASFNSSECTPADVWRSHDMFAYPEGGFRKFKSTKDYSTLGTHPPSNGCCC